MKVSGTHYRSIFVAPDGALCIIDQTRLPHEFALLTLSCLDDAAAAIRRMRVRGAPLIGITAAFGLALGLREDGRDAALESACATLAATRPTAVNLAWALSRMRAMLAPLPPAARAEAAWREAQAMAEADVACNRAIGEHGLALLRELARGKNRPLQILTHCNAGWLATVDHGTALAPVYAAHDAGLPVHVWVSETRPRSQGLLTAWELAQHGVPHTFVVDNAAGHLMTRGEIDAVIVGADRIAANGDAANKIGTYLKGLAAADHGLPFYVAAPRSTIDRACRDGAAIPIEERDGGEVRGIDGRDEAGDLRHVRFVAAETAVANPAFDVTPARLVTRIVTEAGAVAATPEAITEIFE